ncbi:MAG: FAD-binding oxidoreductase [bacterium]|nr:FAD-binding oxidoreductase [bacterium]
MDKLHEFSKILSKSQVTADREIRGSFAQDHSYARPLQPDLVVRPYTADEVINIVNLAREKKYPLVPVSSGSPHFRGDTVPSVNGAVIVDLSAMKRIEWVNRRNRVAVIEPGVTFEELQAELDRQGLRTMFPLSPRSSKSVVGAYMEREPFTLPKYAWDLGDPIASAEIILGDGYRMRTGGGAGPAPTLEGQRKVGGAHKLPFSPFAMDVRRIAQGSQGSMGICTWLAVRCELLPEHEEIRFAGSDDLIPLIEAAYRLIYLRLPDEMYIVNALTLACLMEETPEQIAALRDRLPEWILVLSAGGYGTLPRDQFDYKIGDLEEEAGKLGIELNLSMGGINNEDYHRKVVRRVSSGASWKIRYRGDCRELFFLTSQARTPEFIGKIKAVTKRNKYNPQDMGVYLQLLIQGTACHCQFDLFMKPERVREFENGFTALSQKVFDMGGFFSRPYGVWADIVYPPAKTFTKYARGLKRIFDPALIMNPEKLCFKEMT